MARTTIDHEFQNLHEFVKAANLKLNRFIWDYLIGGAETETTVARGKKLNSLADAHVYAPMARPTMRSPSLSFGSRMFSAITSMLSQVGPASTEGRTSPPWRRLSMG